MVLLGWSLIACDIEERYNKADLTQFLELVSYHGCVWRIEEDVDCLFCNWPNPQEPHLVLILLDYEADGTDPVKLEETKINLWDVHLAFVDAMLSGENSSSDDSRDCDDFSRSENMMWPPQFEILRQGTRLWREIVVAPLELDPMPSRIATGGRLAASAAFDQYIVSQFDDVQHFSQVYDVLECPVCRQTQPTSPDASTGHDFCWQCNRPMVFRPRRCRSQC
jgi:hypothetical protein